MRDFGRPRLWVLGLAFVSLCLAVSTPAEAQREYEPLFDKFNFKGELSWVGFKTSIGLYEDDLDLGGVLNFEDDLNLGDREFTPSLDFEWQIAKRHRLAARYQGLGRNSNSQALTDIEWGDEIIPINADISLSFDITQLFVDYTFYPWVKERWAAGFGLGFRVMDLTTTLTWRLDGSIVEEGSQDADVTAPLPYIYFEYRRLLTEHWRMILGVGWLDVTIGDVSGGQYIGRAGFEYLLGKRWSVGGAFNYADIDAEAKNIHGEAELVNLRATIDMDIWDVSLFGRIRF
ncbi:MAG: hypothetical protein AB1Z65_03765 [Candidatus Sulfomarinibacteraceae bacterium]